MKSTALVLVKHALPVLDPSKPAKEWRLTAEGELQSKRLASRLRAFAPLRLVASPEPKASRTGQLVAAELGLQVSSVEGLRELDRPVLALMSKVEYERKNAAIFADLDRRILGAESGRNALDRFSAAVGAELARTEAQSLVVITHGTVISLFVGAHNEIDAFELWRKLACPSFVVLEVPSFSLREVMVDAAWILIAAHNPPLQRTWPSHTLGHTPLNGTLEGAAEACRSWLFQQRRVAYLEQGAGSPLVLLHAGGSSGKQWVRTASLLENLFRVVAPDLWGFGLTEAWTGGENLSHDHQALLVARVIEEVAAGPAHLVGHSYAGATAVRVVLQRKDLVKTLILVEPILTPLLRLAGEEEAFREYFDMAQAFLSNAATSRLEEAWRGFIDQPAAQHERTGSLYSRGERC